LNEQNTTTIESNFQTPSARNFYPQASRPLKGALIQAAQAKLLSQRARRRSTGRLKSDCLDRITETLQHVCLALERLDRSENDHTEAPRRIQPQFAVDEVAHLEAVL
jgi:hypothetical protein